MSKKFIYDEALYGERKWNPISIVLCFILLWVFILLAIWLYTKLVVYETKHGFSDYDRIYTVFKHHKSPVPNVMANAVLGTAYPYLLTGIAVKESNGTPWAIGDSGKSKGAFQVQEKHWGSVPIEASEQAKQAAAILEALFESRGSLRCRPTLRRTLAQYNGGTRPPKISYRYADAVMRSGSLTTH